jgi:hypothetical protein
MLDRSPAHVPAGAGSAAGWRCPAVWVLLAVVAGLGTCGGCGLWRGRHAKSAAMTAPLENPLLIPPLDRELVWNQLVDAVDDYFRIEREDRMRMVGGVLMEGRIETFPTIGSTLLEPWRVDSTPGYEKWHATLQSIRRRATIRVIPVAKGYLVDVAVHKELEDLDKPEHATAGGATLRHDGTIVRQEGPPGRYSVTLGWIPIGRDHSLEQRILADLVARLDLAGHVSVPLPPEAASDSPPGAAGPEWRPAMPHELEPLPAPRPSPTPYPSAPPPPLKRLPSPEVEPLPAPMPQSAPSPVHPPDEIRRLPPPPETLPAPTGPTLAPP